MSTGTLKKNIIPRNTRLGKQTVRNLIASDFLGDRYTVIFGSTNHVYDINVINDPDTALALATLQKLLAQISPFRHPCLVPYFACGEDDGIVWIRSEHSDGVPDWVTASVKPQPLKRQKAAEEEVEEEEICFPTLRTLLDATDGTIAAKDAAIIVGDLAEALVFLHENGLHAAIISPETLFLDKSFRHSSLIARFRFYGWTEEATPELLAEDVRQAVQLIGLIAEAVSKAKSGKFSRALTALYTELQKPGAILSAFDFYDAVDDCLLSCGVSRTPRLSSRFMDGTAPPASTVNTPSDGLSPVAESKRRHRSRHHRKKKGSDVRDYNARAALGQMGAGRIFRTGLMFVGIIVFGFIVYFGMTFIDERGRNTVPISDGQRYTAISSVGDEQSSDGLQGFPEDVRDYTLEQLRIATERGHAIASARLAISRLEENPGDPALMQEAVDILAPVLPRLESEIETNAAALYWYAYARLLGIAMAPDSTQAERDLQRATERGYLDAHILLGDWFANRALQQNTDDDRLAMRQWRTAFGNSDNASSWTNLQRDAIARIVPFVRARRGFRTNDAMLIDILNAAAAAGHPEAMFLISELHDTGQILEENHALALTWLRRVAASNFASGTLRAEAQRRMADMFAIGRGAPASLSAAKLWYERSAALDNQAAMLTLADFCEAGKGTDSGKGSADEARYWRTKANTAQPFSPTKPPYRLLPTVRVEASSL